MGINFQSSAASKAHKGGSPRCALKFAIENVSELADVAGVLCAADDTEENRQDVAELHRILSSLSRFAEAANMQVRKVEVLEVKL